MTVQSERRLIVRWTALKNALAIGFFAVFAFFAEYIVVSSTVQAGTEDLSSFVLPFFSTEVSLMYHLLPVAVVTVLTACFVHLTTHTTVSRRIQAQRAIKKGVRRRRSRPRALQRLGTRLQRAFRSVKRRFLRLQSTSYVGRKIELARALIRSAVAVALGFVAIALVISVAAYPRLVSTTAGNLLAGNEAFLGFVTGTMRASEGISQAIPPLGYIGTSLLDSLISVAPTFYRSLNDAASAMTQGFVSLGHVEKYIIVQNVAAIMVVTVTLLQSQYAKMRGSRR
jgi:hypothetical protein